MSGLTKEYRPSRSSGHRSSESRHKPYSSDRSSRSGGGGGGGDGCFKCGESGHFSRECPQNRSSRGGGRSSRGRGGSRSGGSSFGGGGNDYGIKGNQAGSGLSAIDWDEVELSSFRRDFYSPTTTTNNLPQSAIDTWYAEHSIECYHGYRESIASKSFGKNAKPTSHKDVPKPILAFADASFPPIVEKAISAAGFGAPTPIQSVAWPIVLGGDNAIGIARTGSGKTLAFLLPAIVHIKAQPPIRRGDGPIAVIVAPTRELACQIEGEVEKFACNTRHCCVYGGAKRYPQQRKLRQGVDIVIATPGRLLDFLESGVTNFQRVTYTVIDEADRLLDMGFEPQLNAIMNQIRPDRQMLMFSATWPREVRELARKYMVSTGDDRHLFQIAIGSMDKLVANQDVLQQIDFVSKFEKREKLKKILDEYTKEDKDCKVLVFISTKKMCNMMHEQLWDDGYWVTCIHGGKEQPARDKALAQFKSGQMKIMLATDVASRGIHIDDIKLVVNFDFPTAIEDYVHRIGRTGRAGQKGTAISLFTDDDGYRAKELIKVLQDANQKVPERLTKYRSKGGGGGRRGGRGGGRSFHRMNGFGRRW